MKTLRNLAFLLLGVLFIVNNSGHSVRFRGILIPKNTTLEIIGTPQGQYCYVLIGHNHHAPKMPPSLPPL